MTDDPHPEWKRIERERDLLRSAPPLSRKERIALAVGGGAAGFVALGLAWQWIMGL